MDVDATPGGLDTTPTVGSTLPFVDTIKDPWEDLIKEHEASVDLTLLLAPKANTPVLRTDEQNEILGIFAQMLAGPLGDGGAKRARGEKPNWKVDPSHEGKARKHLDYVERYDHESGCHKYTHAACRLLMQAYQEMVADGLVPVSPK